STGPTSGRPICGRPLRSMARETAGSVESRTTETPMLSARLLVSALLIPAAIGLLALDARLGPAAPILFVLCVLIALRCGWEATALLRRPAVDPQFGPVA